MHQDHNAPPFNPMPPVVWVLFLILMGIEVVFTLGEQGIVGGARAVGWRLGAISDYGFSGVAFDWMVKNGQMPFEYVIRCFSYMFLHGSFTAAIFSGVILLAMGKLVGEVMGQLAVIILFVFQWRIWRGDLWVAYGSGMADWRVPQCLWPDRSLYIFTVATGCGAGDATADGVPPHRILDGHPADIWYFLCHGTGLGR